MARKSKQRPEIREFILKHVSAHPSNAVALAAAEFGVTRVTAHRYVRRLVEEGELTASGTAKGRTYALRDFEDKVFAFEVKPPQQGWQAELQEDAIWRTNIEPLLHDLPKNIKDLLAYGGTEMINNIIDHSESPAFTVGLQRNAARIRVTISDQGVGVFEKIKRDCNLADSRHALLELSKGKLTTDAAHHSGQGIFFSSRMFNSFSLSSRGLAFIRTMDEEDGWLFEDNKPEEYFSGTAITFELSTAATHSCLDVFAKFQDNENAPGFAKTHVPVRLARYGDEQLVSRSQAKRVLARFDRFAEVMLDFEGVPQIGQAFADEIFRVYAIQHPEVEIVAVSAAPDVLKMIARVKADAASEAKSLE